MHKKIILASLFLSSFLSASDVDILANFNISELPTKLVTIKEAFNTTEQSPYSYFAGRNPYDPNITKIIEFNPWIPRHILYKLPRKKVVLFLWEPELHSPEFYHPYSKVYTWDDSLIDNVKFFRFNYPYLTPFDGNNIPFEEKKLMTVVSQNWSNERISLMKFFEKHAPNNLDCYGRNYPRELQNGLMYKGEIHGLHTGNEKILILKNYKFCMCFEHTVNLPGYITEKIFSCFAAGSVPVYWGASNIEEYIPKECFIDYRDFASDQELLDFLTTMSKERHQEYVDAIKRFLVSDEALIFSASHFDQIIYEASL